MHRRVTTYVTGVTDSCGGRAAARRDHPGFWTRRCDASRLRRRSRPPVAVALCGFWLGGALPSAAHAQAAERSSLWVEIGAADARPFGARGVAFDVGRGWTVRRHLTLGFAGDGIGAAKIQASLHGVAILHPADRSGPFLMGAFGPAFVEELKPENLVVYWGLTARASVGWEAPLGSRYRLRPYLGITYGFFDALEQVRTAGVGLSYAIH